MREGPFLDWGFGLVSYVTTEFVVGKVEECGVCARSFSWLVDALEVLMRIRGESALGAGDGHFNLEERAFMECDTHVGLLPGLRSSRHLVGVHGDIAARGVLADLQIVASEQIGIGVSQLEQWSRPHPATEGAGVSPGQRVAACLLRFKRCRYAIPARLLHPRIIRVGYAPIGVVKRLQSKWRIGYFHRGDRGDF